MFDPESAPAKQTTPEILPSLPLHQSDSINEGVKASRSAPSEEGSPRVPSSERTEAVQGISGSTTEQGVMPSSSSQQEHKSKDKDPDSMDVD